MTNNFDKKPLFVDQAYLKYSNAVTVPIAPPATPAPVASAPALPLTLLGGKFDLPFYYSSLVWDADLTPEGAALSLTPAAGPCEFAVTGGIFSIDELKKLTADPYLVGAQAGLTWSPARRDWRLARKALKVRLAGAYYDYANMKSGMVTTGGSRFGNSALPTSTADVTYLAHRFKEFAVTGEVGSLLFSKPVKLSGDIVTNTAIGASNQGYQFALRWGKTDLPWACEIGGFYQRLERDAVVGQFTDSDFGEGGTDRLGYAVFATIGTLKNSTFGAKWYAANAITHQEKIRRLQVDWVTKF